MTICILCYLACCLIDRGSANTNKTLTLFSRILIDFDKRTERVNKYNLAKRKKKCKKYTYTKKVKHVGASYLSRRAFNLNNVFIHFWHRKKLVAHSRALSPPPESTPTPPTHPQNPPPSYQRSHPHSSHLFSESFCLANWDFVHEML